MKELSKSTALLNSAKVLAAFNISRDAIHTNRGFYYQYLLTLKKWIYNFVNGDNSKLFVEVDEDIKEVGDKLVFTQVKSYASDFSLNSKQVKTSLFNFYLLFIENYPSLQEIQFLFHTNSRIATKDKLLQKWAGPETFDSNTQDRCLKRTREILISQFKIKKNNLLSNQSSADKKKAIKEAFDEALQNINNDDFKIFFLSIRWGFIDNDPISEIMRIENEILLELRHVKFAGHSPYLLINTLLSEIYRTGCKPHKDHRVLTSELLEKIINISVTELQKLIDTRFAALVGTEKYKLIQELEELKVHTNKNTQDIEGIKNQLKSPSVIPKEITLVPLPKFVAGRDADVRTMHCILQQETMMLVNGLGGMGKSSLVKEYCRVHKNYYDHFVWIDAKGDVKRELAFNEVLFSNLGIPFDVSLDTSTRFEILCSRMKEVPGTNLLIVDNLTDKLIIKELDRIVGGSWKIIITSRLQLSTLRSFPVNGLQREDCIALIRKYCNKNDSDATLSLFCEQVGYNTLMIELCSKVVSNSFDLTFESITEYLTKNELDAKALQIDVSLENQEDTKLYSHLTNAFNLSDLNDDERNLLKQFSFLPDAFFLQHFIECYGKEAYSNNRLLLINLSNSLHMKGWLSVENGVVRMNSFVQLIIRHHDKEGFVNMFLINFLCHRLDEVNRIFSSDRIKYMEFAESILSNISEENRGSLKQPLILMENNLLVAHLQLGEYKMHYDRLKILAARAERYLEPNDLTLGIIYLNKGGIHLHFNELELAVEYFAKSLLIFKTNEKRYHRNLISALDGLASAYIEQGKISLAIDTVNTTQEYRLKYMSHSDPLFPLQLNNTAMIYQRMRLFDEAIASLKFAIEVMVDRPENNYYLAIYQGNIAYNYFLKQEFKLALKHQERSNAILRLMFKSDHPMLIFSDKMMASLKQQLI